MICLNRFLKTEKLIQTEGVQQVFCSVFLGLRCPMVRKDAGDQLGSPEHGVTAAASKISCGACEKTTGSRVVTVEVV